MAKIEKTFSCTNCDAQYQKWVGRCLECGKWGTIEADEVKIQKSKIDSKSYTAAKTQKLDEIESKDIARIKSGISEFDRVLGGGLVPGSFILLGGEPGIGKSTLALQLAQLVPNTLYISGEESVEQIKMRADRLKNAPVRTGRVGTGRDLSVRALSLQSMRLANEINVETIISTIREVKPALAIIDSIQTIFSAEVEGEQGNVTQLRACATKLLDAAKSTRTIIVVIGHVTKEGLVAGPRTLEHLVDTVLYLEGDRYHNLRILRTAKNRFGSTDEIGMFAMEGEGLEPVENPSALLLSERGDSMPGSVVTCLVEGSRPLLVEVQALVNKTSFGYPVRKASGFDLNRLHVMIAVLQKRAGLQLGQYDVHINIVGGVKASEPAADLAVCLAIASAFKDKTLGNDLAVFGEVGLGGEIRSVRFLEKRIKECETLGMKRVLTILPGKTKPLKNETIKIMSVKNIAELITHT